MQNQTKLLTKEKILLVDIGGTHIDIFNYSIGSGESTLIQRLSSNALDINGWICSFNKEKISEKYTKIIFGIPGEVHEYEPEVYCPPLNIKIRLEEARSKGIQIVNDMFIQAFLTARCGDNDYEKTIIVNMGTSIGVCIVDKRFLDNHDISFIKSFEFAHESLGALGQSNPIYKLISKNANFCCEKFCSIYSVGGFAAAHGCPLESVDQGMIRVTEKKFRDFLCNAKLDKSITEQWINSLETDLLFYLGLNYSFEQAPRVLLRGGLIDALRSSSNHEILENLSTAFTKTKTL